jgi:hypothetical protein
MARPLILWCELPDLSWFGPVGSPIQHSGSLRLLRMRPGMQPCSEQEHPRFAARWSSIGLRTLSRTFRTKGNEPGFKRYGSSPPLSL